MIANRRTFWENNGQITRHVTIPAHDVAGRSAPPPAVHPKPWRTSDLSASGARFGCTAGGAGQVRNSASGKERFLRGGIT